MSCGRPSASSSPTGLHVPVFLDPSRLIRSFSERLLVARSTVGTDTPRIPAASAAVRNPPIETRSRTFCSVFERPEAAFRRLENPARASSIAPSMNSMNLVDYPSLSEPAMAS